MNAINTLIYVIQDNIMSDINTTALSIKTYDSVIKNLVSLNLQESNSTFAYRLAFGTPLATGSDFSFPVFVTLFNGETANLSVTQQAWESLKIYYQSGTNNTTLAWTATNVKPGYFELTIYHISASQLAGIESGQSLIVAQGEVKVGALTNIAAGVIGSSQITNATRPLADWMSFFGIKSAPPGGWADLGWAYHQSIIWASGGLLVILMFYYYLWRMVYEQVGARDKKAKEEEKEREDDKMRKEIHEMYSKDKDRGGK